MDQEPIPRKETPPLLQTICWPVMVIFHFASIHCSAAFYLLPSVPYNITLHPALHCLDLAPNPTLEGAHSPGPQYGCPHLFSDGN